MGASSRPLLSASLASTRFDLISLSRTFADTWYNDASKHTCAERTKSRQSSDGEIYKAEEEKDTTGTVRPYGIERDLLLTERKRADRLRYQPRGRGEQRWGRPCGRKIRGQPWMGGSEQASATHQTRPLDEFSARLGHAQTDKRRPILSDQIARLDREDNREAHQVRPKAGDPRPGRAFRWRWRRGDRPRQRQRAKGS